MIIAVLVLNLLGMGFLFYVYEQQKKVNSAYIDNIIIHNAILQLLKEKVDKLEEKVKELEPEKK